MHKPGDIDMKKTVRDRARLNNIVEGSSVETLGTINSTGTNPAAVPLNPDANGLSSGGDSSRPMTPATLAASETSSLGLPHSSSAAFETVSAAQTPAAPRLSAASSMSKMGSTMLDKRELPDDVQQFLGKDQDEVADEGFYKLAMWILGRYEEIRDRLDAKKVHPKWLGRTSWWNLLAVGIFGGSSVLNLVFTIILLMAQWSGISSRFHTDMTQRTPSDYFILFSSGILIAGFVKELAKAVALLLVIWQLQNPQQYRWAYVVMWDIFLSDVPYSILNLSFMVVNKAVDIIAILSSIVTVGMTLLRLSRFALHFLIRLTEATKERKRRLQGMLYLKRWAFGRECCLVLMGDEPDQIRLISHLKKQVLVFSEAQPRHLQRNWPGCEALMRMITLQGLIAVISAIIRCNMDTEADVVDDKPQFDVLLRRYQRELTRIHDEKPWVVPLDPLHTEIVEHFMSDTVFVRSLKKLLTTHREQWVERRVEQLNDFEAVKKSGRLLARQLTINLEATEYCFQNAKRILQEEFKSTQADRERLCVSMVQQIFTQLTPCRDFHMYDTSMANPLCAVDLPRDFSRRRFLSLFPYCHVFMMFIDLSKFDEMVILEPKAKGSSRQNTGTSNLGGSTSTLEPKSLAASLQARFRHTFSGPGTSSGALPSVRPDELDSSGSYQGASANAPGGQGAAGGATSSLSSLSSIANGFWSRLTAIATATGRLSAVRRQQRQRQQQMREGGGGSADASKASLENALQKQHRPGDTGDGEGEKKAKDRSGLSGSLEFRKPSKKKAREASMLSSEILGDDGPADGAANKSDHLKKKLAVNGATDASGDKLQLKSYKVTSTAPATPTEPEADKSLLVSGGEGGGGGDNSAKEQQQQPHRLQPPPSPGMIGAVNKDASLRQPQVRARLHCDLEYLEKLCNHRQRKTDQRLTSILVCWRNEAGLEARVRSYDTERFTAMYPDYTPSEYGPINRHNVMRYFRKRILALGSEGNGGRYVTIIPDWENNHRVNMMTTINEVIFDHFVIPQMS
ncbi:hypothetical protein RI367_007112 [Sorochytrium milnesiophthora]